MLRGEASNPLRHSNLAQDGLPHASIALSATADRVVLAAEKNFEYLRKTEEATSIDAVVKEGPPWLLFHLKEPAIAQHVLKNVSVPQCTADA